MNILCHAGIAPGLEVFSNACSVTHLRQGTPGSEIHGQELEAVVITVIAAKV